MPPAVLPTPASVVARSLYLYVNNGAAINAGHYPAPQDVVHRGLYLYVNKAKHGWPTGGEPMDADDVLARVLFLYANYVHDQDPTDVLLRALYQYSVYTDDEPFPWIERIVPQEQYPGGQVGIMGDGFGDSAAAEGGSVRLGTYDPDVAGPGDVMGVVSWQNRSPNLWPANSGVRTEPAIVVTVPPDAESGMLSVEESI